MNYTRRAMTQLLAIGANDFGGQGPAVLAVTTLLDNLEQSGLGAGSGAIVKHVYNLPTGERLYRCSASEFCTVAIISLADGTNVVVYVFSVDEPFNRDKAVLAYRTS